jgi:hypothetical protein
MSDLPEDRKEWHRLEAQFDDDIEKCQRCGGPLEKQTDYVNGIELVCKNPDCPSNN